ncbi:hypothetical protein VMCG_00084 [Cytospora schulzeri]|uniref:Uncharacterized protein n=1 Tax=Cytospora schulzeri TaxID=448051 RepID=A0A423XA22_9PEZI|nr:hypothetical protein VMCG_00084 [Valsa malicola]
MTFDINFSKMTETFLSRRTEDTRTEDFKFLLRTTMVPEYYSAYLQRFLEEPMSDHQELIHFTWQNVIGYIRRMSTGPEDLIRWSAVLRYLIEQGADVHQPTGLRGLHEYEGSAYLSILTAARGPLEADEYIHAWLSMLESFGVPIGSYMEREAQTVYRYWDRAILHYDWPRILACVDFGNVCALSWRWRQDPGEEHFELWEEFQNLIPESFPEFIFLPPSGPADFKVWLASGVNDDCRSYNYPFMVAQLDLYSGLALDGPFGRRPYYVDTIRLALKIREGRFARREARKWRKAHPRERLPTQMIPGSWVD